MCLFLLLGGPGEAVSVESAGSVKRPQEQTFDNESTVSLRSVPGPAEGQMAATGDTSTCEEIEAEGEVIDGGTVEGDDVEEAEREGTSREDVGDAAEEDDVVEDVTVVEDGEVQDEDDLRELERLAQKKLEILKAIEMPDSVSWIISLHHRLQ